MLVLMLLRAALASPDAAVMSPIRYAPGDRVSRAAQARVNRRMQLHLAERSGDADTWERLLVAELSDVGCAEPDLCARYALHLSRDGAGQAEEVILWTTRALASSGDIPSSQRPIWRFQVLQVRVSAALVLAEAAREQVDGGALTPSEFAHQLTLLRVYVAEYERAREALPPGLLD